MIFLRATLLSAALGLLATAPALAHDDDHPGRGHGHKHGHHKHEKHKHKHKHDRHDDDRDHASYEEEYWDGHCKVERKWERDGDYKEERKCKGARPVHVIPAQRVQPVVVYPPWIVVQQGQRAYDPKYQPRPVRTASRCNSDTVGRVLGGIVGGTLGTQIGKGNGRTAAIIGGAVAGVLIGGEVGKRMDAADQGCVGQVLEVAPVDRRVQWAEGPAQYVVVPGRVVSREGSYCRPYTVEVTMEGRRERSEGLACRRGDGVWVAA